MTLTSDSVEYRSADTADTADTALTGTFFAQLSIGVLGVLLITGEIDDSCDL